MISERDVMRALRMGASTGVLNYVDPEILTARSYELALRKGCCYLRDVPTWMLSERMCLIVANRGMDWDWKEFDSIPSRLRTRSVCRAFVKRFPNLLDQVPEEHLDARMCNLAEEHLLRYPELASPEITKAVSRRLRAAIAAAADMPKSASKWVDEIIECSLSYDDLPAHVQADEAVITGACSVSLVFLCSIPRGMRTKRVCMAFLSTPYYTRSRSRLGYIHVSGFDLSLVAKGELDAEVAETAVRNGHIRAEEVSRKLQTEGMWQAFVSEKLTSIAYVPKRFLTENMCLTAVSNSGSEYAFVPRRLRTERVRLAARHGVTWIGHLSVREMNQDICKKAIDDGCSPLYVPKRYMSAEMWETAVRNGHFTSVPHEHLTPHMCEIAVELCGDHLINVPKSMITEDLCRIAVKTMCSAQAYLACTAHTEMRSVTEEEWLEYVSKNHTMCGVPRDMITPLMCMLSISGSSLIDVYLYANWKARLDLLGWCPRIAYDLSAVKLGAHEDPGSAITALAKCVGVSEYDSVKEDLRELSELFPELAAEALLENHSACGVVSEEALRLFSERNAYLSECALAL